MSHTALLLLAALLMLPGLLGAVIPVLPGIPLMFLVAVLFGVVDRFQHLRPVELTVLLALTVLSVAVDHLAGAWGARLGGASAKAALAGLIGMVLGLLAFPPFGGFIGLFLAVLLVELRASSPERAVRAAGGSLLGSLAGLAMSLVLAIVFLASFLAMAWY